jgi:glycopeptide antibiotics resistance protein
MRFSPRALLAFWTGLTLLAVIPWTDFQDHTHWSRVQWVPFITPPVRIIDVVGNILLYVPFGYWFIEASSRRDRLWRAAVCAAVLSVGTEWSQLYSHSRFPSFTDVTCNVLGAWSGAWCARWRARRASKAA